MAKQIIDDTVMENIEILAKLALTCEEREKAREKMQEMLDYIDKLNELSTKEPSSIRRLTSSPNPSALVFLYIS